MAYGSFVAFDDRYFQPSYPPAYLTYYPGPQPYGERLPVGHGYVCPTCGQPTTHPSGVQVGGQLGAFGVGLNAGGHFGGGHGLGAHLGGNLGSHDANVGFQFGGR